MSDPATLSDGTVLRERTAGSLGLAGRDGADDDSYRWTPQRDDDWPLRVDEA